MPIGDAAMERCLDTSKALGAHDPDFATDSLLFQQTEQRDILAIALGGMRSGTAQLSVRGVLPGGADGTSLLLRRKAHRADASEFIVDGATEGYAAACDLDARFRGQSHPLARPGVRGATERQAGSATVDAQGLPIRERAGTILRRQAHTINTGAAVRRG